MRNVGCAALFRSQHEKPDTLRKTMEALAADTKMTPVIPAELAYSSLSVPAGCLTRVAGSHCGHQLPSYWPGSIPDGHQEAQAPHD